MRLRLSILRSDLPPVHILWGVQDVRAPRNTSSATTTVAEFIQLVNEVIPLDNSGHGLEDYAVEVGGFECLHFLELGSVLKDEDQVTIRYLQSSELKYRRRSGRHRISEDGRHLVDGVPFLRPKPLSRIRFQSEEISHLKRPRSVFLEGNNEIEEELDHLDSHDSKRQMFYFNEIDQPVPQHQQSDIYDAISEAQNEPSSGDDDFQPNEESDGEEEYIDISSDEGENDLENELLALQQDLTPPDLLQNLRGTDDGDLQDNIVVDKELDDNAASYAADQTLIPNRQETRGNLISNSSPGQNSGNVGGGEEGGTRMPYLQSEAQDLPSSDDNRSNDPEIDPRVHVEVLDSGHLASNAVPNETHSVVSSKPSSSEAYNPDSSRSSDSDSESGSNSGPNSDSNSGSTSSSDSEIQRSSPVSNNPENFGSALAYASEPFDSTVSAVATKVSNIEDQKPLAGKPDLEHVAPPGMGSTRTHKRNKRKRAKQKLAKDSQKLKMLISCNRLPPSATLADFYTWEELNKPTQAQHDTFKSSTTNPPNPSNMGNDIEAKRQQLLNAIASGGIDVDRPIGQDQQTTQSVNGKQSSSFYPPATGITESRLDNDDENENAKVLPSITQGNTKLSTETVVQSYKTLDDATMDSPQQRVKLDVASSKRMVFGSLRLRMPKSKSDEDSSKSKLSVQSQSPTAEKKGGFDSPSDHYAHTSPENLCSENDNLKKVDLRAVECCHEGVILSTPPFPFNQRWDPQQQTTYQPNVVPSRKNKRKKKNADNDYERYYDNQQDGQAVDGPYIDPDVSLRTTETGNNFSQDNSELRQSQKVEGNTNDANIRGIEVEPMKALREKNDLPPLPKDLDALADLTVENAQVGAIIVFKQLELSQSTSWEPYISACRTASIATIHGDGTIGITLAIRDRLHSNRNVDEKTGKRLYSKFEMPGYNEGEDDGYRRVKLSNLIDSKLLKAACLPDSDLAPAENITNALATGSHNNILSALPEQQGSEAHSESRQNSAGRRDSKSLPGKITRVRISDLIGQTEINSSVNSKPHHLNVGSHGDDDDGEMSDTSFTHFSDEEDEIIPSPQNMSRSASVGDIAADIESLVEAEAQARLASHETPSAIYDSTTASKSSSDKHGRHYPALSHVSPFENIRENVHPSSSTTGLPRKFESDAASLDQENDKVSEKSDEYSQWSEENGGTSSHVPETQLNDHHQVSKLATNKFQPLPSRKVGSITQNTQFQPVGIPHPYENVIKSKNNTDYYHTALGGSRSLLSNSAGAKMDNAAPRSKRRF